MISTKQRLCDNSPHYFALGDLFKQLALSAISQALLAVGRPQLCCSAWGWQGGKALPLALLHFISLHFAERQENDRTGGSRSAAVLS